MTLAWYNFGLSCVDRKSMSESDGHRRNRVRVPQVICFCIVSLILTFSIFAQSPNGTINGRILDPSGAAIVGAEITIVNDATRVQYGSKTNGEGIYVVTNLPPGPYRLQVAKPGFKTLIKPDIVLNVQDSVAINFTLPIGAVADTVTVEGGAPLVDTQSAAVSTVIDRNYVSNMPLNGRSFQNLILLTPGVVTNTPQVSAYAGGRGEVSVNGQRTESNYYSVDGVGANVGINPLTAAQPGGVSGSLPAPTALGTTQGLVSVDALEEFRIQSSTYSAEYGRSPGGQFSFLTRSGTNQWHGTASDYLRNDYFDANDWFNNSLGQPKPPLRQNDFGGTLGGPIIIPRVYDGKDKTFFFFSYEGLRLLQPQAATIAYVPDTSLRANTPPPLQQVLNAFPVQNGPEVLDQMGDRTGLAEFIGTWSNPSSIDSTSVRMDHAINDKLRLFFRFSDTSSDVSAQGVGVPSVLDSTGFTSRTYTLGVTSSFSNRLSNELRLNYSSNEGTQSYLPVNFGGAKATSLFQLSGFAVATKPSPFVEIGLSLGNFSPIISQGNFYGQQSQWNLVDTIGLTLGRHQLKFGFDFRRLDPSVYESSPAALYDYGSIGSVQANTVDYGFAISHAPQFPVYTNVSSFAQDELRATSRLRLSMGLRWEVNPAPGAAKGNLPYTLEGNSLSTFSLAPQGTPLWNTTWFNFAPRLGAAYILRNAPGHETVIRGGGGVFFDTGQQLGSYGYDGPGFSATNFLGSLFGVPASFPVSLAEASPPIVNPPVAPYANTNSVAAFPAHLQLPYTLQWNASVQQALGKSATLTVSYVGANGRRLLEQNQVNLGSLNPNIQTTIVSTQNGGTSDYNSLQIQFQRRLAHGLQALGSYTWAHAIDYGSVNAGLPYKRGNSDFDVRHNFSSAFSYDLPNLFQIRLAKAILGDWGVDDRFTARTGFPVTLIGPQFTDPATGNQLNADLNLVPGQPTYIYGSQCLVIYGTPCPGGRAINPSAFTPPPGCTVFACSGQVGAGDAPRNFARGFGEWQMDLAVRREFPIHERLKLQFRAESFNIFNHPNFGAIHSTYCSAGAGTGCFFGEATATLANSLGGLSPLYQTGGPRSMQFALKLIF